MPTPAVHTCGRRVSNLILSGIKAQSSRQRSSMPDDQFTGLPVAFCKAMDLRAGRNDQAYQ